jgi:2-oxoglutarate ferredoxin oxidoreductase subunit alpha
MACWAVLNNLVIGLAGSGGDGVISAGESLIATAAHQGYRAMLTKSYGSQIRGGESCCRVRVSTDPVLNPGGVLTVAVVLNWEYFMRFGPELPLGAETAVIHEAKFGPPPAGVPLGLGLSSVVRAVPIEAITLTATGKLQAKNSVVLGLMAGWFGFDPDGIRDGIRHRFAYKGEDVLRANERAFQAGLDHARADALGERWKLAPPIPAAGPRVVCDGNDLCAAAALFAGCKFFGGYPITPATEIMQIMQKKIWKHGGSLLQAEDEIAGIGAAIGASFAGKKAMTATSGPGLSLMAEMLGLASAAELPLVCVDVQRGGPSTGMPTKREQSDLFAAAFSSHGDTVRPILAPMDVADTYGVTVEAFNLAETYQTPVIVLSDQEIAQRKEVIDVIDTSGLRLVDRLAPTAEELTAFTRFRFTDSGISAISHPGMKGGGYLAAGIEHDESGAPNSNGTMHARMGEKRLRKLDPLQRRRDLFFLEGDPDAALGLISWGSVAGIVREAVRAARAEGIAVKLLVPKLIYPVAREIYEEFFAPLQVCLVVEQSQQGQLHRLLHMWTTVPEEFISLTRCGANPIAPQELLEHSRALGQGAGVANPHARTPSSHE